MTLRLLATLENAPKRNIERQNVPKRNAKMPSIISRVNEFKELVEIWRFLKYSIWFIFCFRNKISGKNWKIKTTCTALLACFPLNKETLRKGKVQYNWPPYTDLLRSAAFYIANIIHFLRNELLQRGVHLYWAFPFS